METKCKATRTRNPNNLHRMKIRNVKRGERSCAYPTARHRVRTEHRVPNINILSLYFPSILTLISMPRASYQPLYALLEEPPSLVPRLPMQVPKPVPVLLVRRSSCFADKLCSVSRKWWQTLDNRDSVCPYFVHVRLYRIVYQAHRVGAKVVCQLSAIGVSG